jgi:NAD-dependent SIR2 family protein deacetylase
MSVECQHCGGHVTDSYARVFGTNDGEVYGCPDCMNGRAIRNGAPAKTDS